MVTGAAGGLGQSLCKEAISRGWQVVALDRSAPTEALRGWMEAGQADVLSGGHGRPRAGRGRGRARIANGGGAGRPGEQRRRGARARGHAGDHAHGGPDAQHGHQRIRAHGTDQAHTAAFAQKPLGGHRQHHLHRCGLQGRAGDRLSLRDLKCAFTMFPEKLRAYLREDGIRVRRCIRLDAPRRWAERRPRWIPRKWRCMCWIYFAASKW